MDKRTVLEHYSFHRSNFVFRDITNVYSRVDEDLHPYFGENSIRHALNSFMDGLGTNYQYRPCHSQSFDGLFLSSIMSAFWLMDEKVGIKGQLIPFWHISKTGVMFPQSHNCACGATSLYPAERSFTILHGPFVQSQARVQFDDLLETRCVNMSQRVGLDLQSDLIPRFYCNEHFERAKRHRVCTCGNFAQLSQTG